MAKTREGKIEGHLSELSSSIQETTVNRLEKRLGDFMSKVDRIPSPTPPPRTTLQIQGNASLEKPEERADVGRRIQAPRRQ